jgi:cytoskeleton protein RodZ
MTFNDRNTDKNNTEAPLKHRWGTRFKTARETLNLTEKDVASRLHLKPNLITIIESERFENGPPPIFMRGYIRSYARLLNLSEKEITQALAQLDLANPATSTPTPMVRKRVSTPNNSGTGWSTSLVVLVLVGLVGMWWNTHSRNSLKDSTENMQSTQTIAPVASNVVQASDSTLARAPADPTPKELLSQPVVASTAANKSVPAPANNTATPVIASSAPATVPAAQHPAANTAPKAKTELAATTPPASEEAETSTNAALNPDTTSDATDQQSALPSTPETEVEAKPAKTNTHMAKAKTPEMASDDMAIPEQGLEPEDNNN